MATVPGINSQGPSSLSATISQCCFDKKLEKIAAIAGAVASVALAIFAVIATDYLLAAASAAAGLSFLYAYIYGERPGAPLTPTTQPAVIVTTPIVPIPGTTSTTTPTTQSTVPVPTPIVPTPGTTSTTTPTTQSTVPVPTPIVPTSGTTQTTSPLTQTPPPIPKPVAQQPTSQPTSHLSSASSLTQGTESSKTLNSTSLTRISSSNANTNSSSTSQGQSATRLSSSSSNSHTNSLPQRSTSSTSQHSSATAKKEVPLSTSQVPSGAAKKTAPAPAFPPEQQSTKAKPSNASTQTISSTSTFTSNPPTKTRERSYSQEIPPSPHKQKSKSVINDMYVDAPPSGSEITRHTPPSSTGNNDGPKTPPQGRKSISKVEHPQTKDEQNNPRPTLNRVPSSPSLWDKKMGYREPEREPRAIIRPTFAFKAPDPKSNKGTYLPFTGKQYVSGLTNKEKDLD